MRRSGVLIGVVIVIIIAIGVFLLVNRGDKVTPAKTTTPSTQSSTTQHQHTTTSNNTNQSTQPVSAATVTYSSSGFSPSSLTIKAGTKVTVKNDSSEAISFNSNPHPVHTDDPELNIDEIAAGQSGSFTATTKGTHGYHNHLNPSQTGTLVVQ